MADLSRETGHGSALGVLSSIMDVGHSAGPMVSGLLISAYSYRATFGLVGLGMGAISLVFYLGMSRTGVKSA